MVRIAELPLVQKIARRVRRHGWWSCAQQAAWKLLRSAFGLRLLRGLCLHEVEELAGADAGYAAGFQPADALRRFAADPRTEISPRFLDGALRRGDRCFGICEGDALVSSTWYATRPTPIGPAGPVLQFAPRYVYMYKALTQASHRGRRLYALGVSRALEYYRAKGALGFVSYVEATNLDSLKACLRMGFRHFGSVYLVTLFGRHFAFATRGCGKHGFRLLEERAARRDRPERLDAAAPHADVPVVEIHRRVAVPGN